jgi:hypothetical protein
VRFKPARWDGLGERSHGEEPKGRFRCFNDGRCAALPGRFILPIDTAALRSVSDATHREPRKLLVTGSTRFWQPNNANASAHERACARNSGRNGICLWHVEPPEFASFNALLPTGDDGQFGWAT